MKIEQGRFIDLLGREGVRFSIPVFQRTYSWSARQCEEFFEDVMAAGEGEGPASVQAATAAQAPAQVASPAHDPAPTASHFMGMLLYVLDPEGWRGIARYDVIDGQQRLTTLTVLLCVLCRYLNERGGTVAGMTADDIADRYLRVAGSNADAADQPIAGKLELSQADRETLFAVVGTADMPEAPSSRILDNLELFYAKFSEGGFDVERLWRGVCNLEIASVQMEQSDSPQLVFESLNAKGMPLATADRIRNYVIVVDGGEQAGVYENAWLPFERAVADASAHAVEQLCGNAEAAFDATRTIHAWLSDAFRSERILDPSEIYGVFKTCLRNAYDDDLSRLLGDLSDYATRLGADEDFREAEFKRADEWEAGKPAKSISELKLFGD